MNSVLVELVGLSSTFAGVYMGITLGEKCKPHIARVSEYIAQQTIGGYISAMQKADRAAVEALTSLEIRKALGYNPKLLF